MAMTSSKAEFLVKIDDRHFYMRADGREISVTDVPSCAAHLPYLQADALCQRLLRRRFSGAIVTDALGNPVTLATLRGESPKPIFSLPETTADVDAIPARELKRRFVAEPDFRERVRAIEATRDAVPQ